MVLERINPMRRYLIPLLALGLILFAFNFLPGRTELQEGDIVFQRSIGEFGNALAIATQSERTHVGVVFFEDDVPMVFEAVQPVRAISFERWKQNGKHGAYEVKRLKNAKALLSDEVIRQFKELGQSWMGKNYDGVFHPSDKDMYCSELVWKLYKRVLNIELGQYQELSSFSLDSELVRKRLEMHFGKTIPTDRKIISPQAIFDSPHLIDLPSSASLVKHKGS